jgi:putative tricarboxylic transport membrane protein
VPFLLIMLSIGAFTANNAWQDIVVMLAAAAFGVICIHWDWPRVPFLLAVVLGAVAERYLFLSYSLDGWTWLNDPIVVALIVVVVLVMFGPPVRRVIKQRRTAAQAAKADHAGVAR